MHSLRLAFMGTPDFAAASLAALLASNHTVVCVYSQPPRPSGRGHQVQTSPVHRLAEAHGIEVRTPARLRGPDAQAAFAALELDVAVVAAYGLILPKPILEAPRHGCLNVHASILPRWRGAAPIQRAILAGDSVTGVTIMKMDIGLDTGPMLVSEAVPITPATTATRLHDDLAALGARLIGPALEAYAAGDLVPQPQPVDGVTYAAKLEREDGRLAFASSATFVERQVRALTPWPGAWFEAAGERIKVLAAEVTAPATSPDTVPGTVLDDQFTVACGDGAVRLATVQRPGRAAVDGAACLRGFALPPGSVLPGGAAPCSAGS